MDETLNIAEPTPVATETLVSDAAGIVVGEAKYVVKTFCFAKTVRTFALLTQLAEAAGISKVVASADDGTEDEKTTQAGFISQLFAALPKALTDGTPAIYKLLGLIVTGNKELKKLEREDGVDVEAVLMERGTDIAYDGSTEEVLGLIGAAVQVMGVETIIKNVRPLMGLLRR